MQSGRRRARSPSSPDEPSSAPSKRSKSGAEPTTTPFSSPPDAAVAATAPESHLPPSLADSPPATTTTAGSAVATLSPRVGDMGRTSNGTASNGESGTNGAVPGPSTPPAPRETNGAGGGGPSSLRDAVTLVQPDGDLMYEDDKDWADYQEDGMEDVAMADEHQHEDGEAHAGPAQRIKGALAGTKRMPVDREEVVRLILQGLRDIGYNQSADVLEVESGFTLASQHVTDFQAAILGGRWSEALGLLPHLGIPIHKSTSVATMAALVEEPIVSSASSIASGKMRAAAAAPVSQSTSDSIRFLISQQKYLELLEIGSQKKALAVLRNELAAVAKDSEILHALSGFMMCMDRDDLYERAQWDGAAGTSRRRLLEQLQTYISPQVMVPSRRLATLLDQARRLQQNACPYHTDTEPFSLYTDHECASGQFPSVTTHVLADHTDEVFNLAWSPDGEYLATAGQDKVVVIWKLISAKQEGGPAFSLEPLFHLRDHRDPVLALAWSPDGKTLVTAADRSLYLWNTETGTQMATPSSTSQHMDEISAIVWLPDGSEFIVSSMDCKLIFYSATGEMKKQWSSPSLQFRDFAISPDGTKIVVAMTHIRRLGENQKARPSMSGRPAHDPQNGISGITVEEFGYEVMEHGVMVIRLSDKEILDTLTGITGEISSVTLSGDGKRFLINIEDEDIRLYSIEPQIRLIRKYSGHVQHRFLIRNAFGAAKDRFILSGSEDGHVYVWQANSSTPIEVLQGHAACVNAIAWNPVLTRRLFASCSDDQTVRIWQPPVSETRGGLSGGDETMVGNGGQGGREEGIEL